MVKIHCDRCGNEIQDRYYTINVFGHDVDPKPNYATACSATAYSGDRDGVLRMLNSTKMYCEKCKDEIEKFVKKKPEDTNEGRVECMHQWEWWSSSGEFSHGKCYVTYHCTRCGEKRTEVR